MSSTDQQSSHPAPADAEVPSEHEVPEDLGLAAEFPKVTRDEWRELVAGVLRKAGREDLPEPVEEVLRRPVATGVTVAPLYTAADAADLPTAVGVPGLPPFVRGSRASGGPAGSAAVTASGGAEGGAPGGWDIRQRHAHPDVAVTKEAIAADLENGVTSLGLDPLGEHAASGQPQDLSGLAGIARRAAAHRGLRTVVVDGTVFADAGASAVEELGCSLAAGVAYLRALIEGGLSVDEAFAALEFRYAATADQFTTIAGLRAARRLWDRVGEVS